MIDLLILFTWITHNQIDLAFLADQNLTEDVFLVYRGLLFIRQLQFFSYFFFAQSLCR